MIIHLSDLSNYTEYPKRGTSKNSGSIITDIEFVKDDLQHYATVDVYVEYETWYSPQTSFHPEELEEDILNYCVRVLNLQIEEEEILCESDIKEIEKYITDNIEIL